MKDNSEAAKKRRRKGAEERQSEHDALTLEQKIQRLVERVGTSGAVRESSRLTQQLSA